MRRLTAPLVRCALVLALLLAPVACGEPRQDKVTIMVPWSGTEFQAFYAVVKAFEKDHDIDVEPQVTRALTQQLDAAVAADAEPDLAVLPSVGAIAKYREEGRCADSASTRRPMCSRSAGSACTAGRSTPSPSKPTSKASSGTTPGSLPGLPTAGRRCGPVPTTGAWGWSRARPPAGPAPTG